MALTNTKTLAKKTKVKIEATNEDKIDAYIQPRL